MKYKSICYADIEVVFILLIWFVFEFRNEFLCVAFKFNANLDKQGIGKLHLLPILLVVSFLNIVTCQVDSSSPYVTRCPLESMEAIDQFLLVAIIQALCYVGKALIK